MWRAYDDGAEISVFGLGDALYAGCCTCVDESVVTG